jgi:hypothetical protein
MQKVEGSSPFIRSIKGPGNGAFCWRARRRRGPTASAFASGGCRTVLRGPRASLCSPDLKGAAVGLHQNTGAPLRLRADIPPTHPSVVSGERSRVRRRSLCVFVTASRKARHLVRSGGEWWGPRIRPANRAQPLSSGPRPRSRRGSSFMGADSRAHVAGRRLSPGRLGMRQAVLLIRDSPASYQVDLWLSSRTARSGRWRE